MTARLLIEDGCGTFFLPQAVGLCLLSFCASLEVKPWIMELLFLRALFLISNVQLDGMDSKWKWGGVVVICHLKTSAELHEAPKLKIVMRK